MSESRLPDYLAHMQQAATDACSFVEGLNRDDFLDDKLTQQADIDLDVVWETVQTGLPELRQELSTLQRPSP